MPNIADLEARHAKYKMKMYLPYLVILALFILIAVLSYFLMYNTNFNKETDTQPKITNISNAQPDKEQLKDVNFTKSTEESKELNDSRENKLIFTPSLNFLKNMQTNPQKINEAKNSATPYKKQIPNIVIQREEQIVDIQKEEQPTTTQKEEKTVKNEKTAETLPQQNRPTVKNSSISSAKMSLTKEDNDIGDVIKRFNMSKNPTLGLFIAKKYYQAGDYENAYNYALTTNSIDSSLDESWIIFSKALVKLNKKDKATQILEQYISYSKSQNAKTLLDDIKSGKFK